MPTSAATALSGLDGKVAFAPATIAGVATDMRGMAATGDASSVGIYIEQHP